MVHKFQEESSLSKPGAVLNCDQSYACLHRPIRLLTFTTLFPHHGRPNHGIFVENRLRHLTASGKATSIVVAPVPWFPSRSPRFGDWAKHAEANRQERRSDIQIHHPRYLLLPRIGMSLAPIGLFLAGMLAMRRLRSNGLDIDVIDAHYIFPDGVAAVALGRFLKKPVVLTARGSDITQFPSFHLPGKMIRWAMLNATALISVSAGLKAAMTALGAPEQKITVLRNGIDLEQFRPLSPVAARKSWNCTKKKVIISVGHLITRKRHDITIKALQYLPDWILVIVGDGPEKSNLHALVTQLNLTDRVIFFGSHPHDKLAELYSGGDISVLASSREGWANVLLESMACGTPVVASNIPGNPEVVTELAAGLIVKENTPICFADTIEKLYQTRLPRSVTRKYAEAFDWKSTTDGQLTIFRQVTSKI